MRVAFLYAAVVLIWGSTWAVIPYQLGSVAEEVSVAYRFALGSLSLFLYAALTRRRVGIPLRQYGMIVLTGSLMFSANYLFVYYSINHVTSGLVAVVFSLLVVINGFFERMFFGVAFEKRLVLASLFGVAGITCLFWPEIDRFSLADETLVGVGFALIAVVLASLGNMGAIVNNSRNLPVVSVNAHGMAWGALMSLGVAAVTGKEINFSTDTSYVLSLLYLAVAGSAMAFGCYIALLRQIGAARAAYTSVLFPIVALSISTIVEDYHWTALAVAGVCFSLTGNWLALTRTKRKTIQ